MRARRALRIHQRGGDRHPLRSASKKVRSLLELVVSALMKPSHTAPLFQAVVSLMSIGHQELTVKRFMLMASNVGTLIPIRVITLLASDLVGFASVTIIGSR